MAIYFFLAYPSEPDACRSGLLLWRLRLLLRRLRLRSKWFKDTNPDGFFTVNMFAKCFFKKRILPCSDVMDFLNTQDDG